METEAGHPDPEKEDSRSSRQKKRRTERKATRRRNCIGGDEVGGEILERMRKMEAGMKTIQGDVEKIRREITRLKIGGGATGGNDSEREGAQAGNVQEPQRVEKSKIWKDGNSIENAKVRGSMRGDIEKTREEVTQPEETGREATEGSNPGRSGAQAGNVQRTPRTENPETRKDENSMGDTRTKRSVQKDTEETGRETARVRETGRGATEENGLKQGEIRAGRTWGPREIETGGIREDGNVTEMIGEMQVNETRRMTEKRREQTYKSRSRTKHTGTDRVAHEEYQETPKRVTRLE